MLVVVIMDGLVQTGIAVGRGYCLISKIIAIVTIFCCMSVFVWGFNNRNDKNLYTTTTTGTLSNVQVTTEMSSRGQTSYSMIGQVTYTFKGESKTQNITGSKVYSDGQKVQLLVNPKTGESVLKDSYVSPAKLARYVMAGACCFSVLMVIWFFVLSTDVGCAVAVAGQIFSRS